MKRGRRVLVIGLVGVAALTFALAMLNAPLDGELAARCAVQHLATQFPSSVSGVVAEDGAMALTAHARAARSGEHLVPVEITLDLEDPRLAPVGPAVEAWAAGVTGQDIRVGGRVDARETCSLVQSTVAHEADPPCVDRFELSVKDRGGLLVRGYQLAFYYPSFAYGIACTARWQGLGWSIELIDDWVA
jgi:hypothetical protein